ncbi:MAG: DNA methyltransferase [Candidatus Dormiibacterota bacterium]
MTARSGSLKLEEAPQHAGNKPCGSMESGQVKPTLSGGALQMDTHDRNSRHLTQPLYYTGKWWARRLAGITSWMVQLAVDGTPDSVVLDPFSGSGTTVGEALRLGHRSIGVEVNPYAALLSEVALAPRHPMLDAATAMIVESALKEISPVHLPLNGGLPAGYFWAFRQRCPTCKRQSYLLHRTVIAQDAYHNLHTGGWAFCPHSEHIFPIANVNLSKCKCPCGRMIPLRPRSGGFRCWHCQANLNPCGDDDSPTPPSSRLIAVEVRTGHARDFLAPTQEQRHLAQFTSTNDLLSPSPIASGHSAKQVLRWGYSDWRELLHPRQTLLISALTKRIAAISDASLRRQVALTLSGIIDYHSRLCGFKGIGTGSIRQAFASPFVHPTTISYEANPLFVNGSGDVRSWYKRHALPGVVAYSKLEAERGRPIHTGSAKAVTSGKASLAIICADSRSLRLPDQSVDAIVTDPPYFDRIFYDDLASPFVTWLRWCDIGVPPASTGIESDCLATFAANLHQALRPAIAALRKDGRLVFTYHHQNPDAWIALAEALQPLELVSESFWLVQSEMTHSRDRQRNALPISCDAILSFRKGARSEGMPNPCLAGTRAQTALAAIGHALPGDSANASGAAAVITALACAVPPDTLPSFIAAVMSTCSAEGHAAGSSPLGANASDGDMLARRATSA